MALKNGKYAIVEYSELSAFHMEQRNDSGTLVYGLGSILVFAFSARFLLDLVSSSDSSMSLYHKANKKVEYCDLQKMEKVTPEAPNAWKFELFIQNCMACIPSGKLGVLQVPRASEFAPVKNADGDGAVVNDSPASALGLMLAEATTWLKNAGKIEPAAEGQVEVSYLLSY